MTIRSLLVLLGGALMIVSIIMHTLLARPMPVDMAIPLILGIAMLTHAGLQGFDRD